MASKKVDPEETLSILSKQKPKFRDAHDAVSFLLHAEMLRRGCTLVGLTEGGDNKKPITDCPSDWNKSDEAYTFKYLHPSTKEPIVMKMLRMENSLLVHAAKKEDGKVYSATFKVEDYVEPKAPLTEYSKIFKDVEGILTLFQSTIADKVAPPPKVSDETQVGKNKRTTTEEEKAIPDDFWGGIRVPPIGRPGIGLPGGPRGDFGGDLSPFAEGGGNLYGPGQFPFRIGGGPLGPTGPLPRPGGPGGPRFDPFGPFSGIGQEPDPDDLRPPGPGRPGRRGGPPDII